MAPLTQLTLDADGTLGTVDHDAGTGAPYNTHCNDAPDGGSADYVFNRLKTSGAMAAWFRLSNVDADFSSMLTLNIDADLQAVSFAGDTCTLTARIYDADNDTTNALTAESGNLGTEADSTRTQRNVVFGTLAGSEAQWNAAHIRFTWTVTKNGGWDDAELRLFGCDIDGTYTASSGSIAPQAAYLTRMKSQ